MTTKRSLARIPRFGSRFFDAEKPARIMDMKLIVPIIVAIGMLMTTSQSFAINKCLVEGKVIFQDQACASGQGGRIEVKPASGPSGVAATAPLESAADANKASAKPQSEAERLDALTAQSQKERRLVLLEARLIPDAEGSLQGKRRTCDQELSSLRARKTNASNNLAGATWEQSLSTEMAAIATRCDTEMRMIQDDLSRFRLEVSSLRRTK